MCNGSKSRPREKDSLKLHIKMATCDLIILYNKCNFSYHQCLEINCLFICVAVRAGGMRIVQKHQSANDVPDKKNDKDSEEYETEM